MSRLGLKARHNRLARTWRADHWNGRRALGYLEANAQDTNGRHYGVFDPMRRTRPRFPWIRVSVPRSRKACQLPGQPAVRGIAALTIIANPGFPAGNFEDGPPSVQFDNTSAIDEPKKPSTAQMIERMSGAATEKGIGVPA